MTTRASPVVGVMISGRGSNLQSLIDAERAGAPYRIAAVISNVPDAPGLDKARAAHIPAIAIDHRPFNRDRAAWEGVAMRAFQDQGVGFVALAGFMRVLTPRFIGAYAGHLINIHPSLLPLFRGLDSHARAIESGMALAGCSVHHVTEGVDEGAIIGQAAIPIAPNDTPETLADRLIQAEHALYPACLSQLVTGKPVPAPKMDGAIFSLRAP